MPTCIIIGGGAAGLFAAARLGTVPGLEVLIIEGQESPGRKLLITGSGQCNLTNTAPLERFLSSYGAREQGRFLRTALHGVGPEAVMSFFRGRGIDLLVREDGKVFPASLRARDVLDALFAAVRDSGARIVTGRRVSSVRRDGGFRVTAGTDGWEEILTADCVLLAAGGASYPETGSRGDGCGIAAALGHRIEPTRPALSPIRIARYPFAGLAGLALRNVRLTLWKEGGGDPAGRRAPGARGLAAGVASGGSGALPVPSYPPAGMRKGPEAEGDLLFAHRWITGPAILRLSRFADPGDLITMNWSGVPNAEAFLAEFPAMLRASAGKPVGTLIGRIGAPKRFPGEILRRSGIGEEERCGTIAKDRARALATLIAALPLEVEGPVGWHAAMVTAGGVALGEVDPKSMESRLVPGLFFAGEVLDIDGETGGFNLQAAFSTADLAARAIRRRYGGG